MNARARRGLAVVYLWSTVALWRRRLASAPLRGRTHLLERSRTSTASPSEFDFDTRCIRSCSGHSIRADDFASMYDNEAFMFDDGPKE